MQSCLRSGVFGIGLIAAAFGVLTPGAARAENNGPPFDFSDSFYLRNGINPAAVGGRPTGLAPNSIADTAPDADHRNVRSLNMTAGIDHSGHPIYIYVVGVASAATFTNDAAGQRARQIADQFDIYEFPRATNAPFGVFPKRQDFMADLSGGYFSNDPTGIWKVNLVRYTPAALTTPAGQAALRELGQRNGLDLDGTPMIRSKDEIESLRQSGYVTVEVPAADGSQGLRWFFCPVVEDPRNGSITPDAFLSAVKLGTGAVLPAEADIAAEFSCLKSTGDFCNAATAIPKPGDMNCDGAINNFDIDVFVQALIDPAGYAAAVPVCNRMNGNVNGDGRFDNFDIDPFVAMILGQ